MKTPQQQPPKPTVDSASVTSEGSHTNSLSASVTSAKQLFGSTNSLNDSKRVITLEQALDQLHLSNLLPKFEQECVDFDALVSIPELKFFLPLNRLNFN